MTYRKSVFLLNAATVTALSVAILAFVNAITSERFARLDLTEERTFTLDPLSREIARKFTDTVTVRYYVTPDLFPPSAEYETLSRDVVDRLNEYAAHSDGRIRVEVLDPRSDEKKKEIDAATKEKMEAEGVGVSSETIQKDDKPYPKEFLSTIKLNYADKTDVLADVKSLDNLEFRVTKALRRLQVQKLPKVGFYFAGEEKGFGRDGNFTQLPDVLRQEFLVDTVDLGEKNPVPDDVDVLFVVASDRIPDRHRFAIDQYLMNGRKVEAAEGAPTLDAKGNKEAKEAERQPGRVVFLLDTFDESRRANREAWGQPALFSKLDAGIDEMLGSWGIRGNSDLVLDLDRCAYGQIMVQVWVQGVGFVERPKTVRWPRIILSRNENYSKDLVFVNRLDQIAFIDPTSLSATDPLPAGIEFEPAIRTSKKSWRLDFKTSPFILGSQVENLHEEPDAKQAKANPEGAQYVLAGVWRGSFKSFFAGKPVPAPEKRKEDNPEDIEKKEEKPEDKPPKVVERTVKSRVLAKGDEVIDRKDEEATTRVVVIGDTHAFSDFVMRHQHRPNVDFLVNLIEWLTTEETLSAIKAKGARARPLTFERRYKGLYLALLICGVPLLVLLLGTGVLTWRRIDKSLWIRSLQGPPPGASPPAEAAGPGAGPVPPAPPAAPPAQEGKPGTGEGTGEGK